MLYSRTTPRIEILIKLAEKKGVDVKKASRETLDKLAGKEMHRGVLLLVPALKLSAGSSSAPRDIFDQLENRQSALVLVLDGITDPQNLGAVLRSADQFDVDLVITPHRGSAQENATVRKASAGASAWVPVLTVPNLTRVLKELKDKGFWIYGAHMEGTRADRIGLTGKTALVMGSEGKGIRRLVADSCDGLLSIPTGGHIDSLNVSVAAGILLYEIRRQGLTADDSFGQKNGI